MKSQPFENLLSESEVSKILGVKPRTLQQWRLLGKGPKYIRLSERMIRYSESDIRNWLDRQQKS